MSNTNVTGPRLTAAPTEYDQVWMNNLMQILRLYFNQLDNNGPITISSLGVGSKNVVSAIACIAPNPTNLNTFAISLPTQADLPNLRSGSIYYDTSANNVLKIKP